MCITYKKFCGCCCNVITASKIIAILELILGLIGFNFDLVNIFRTVCTEFNFDYYDTNSDYPVDYTDSYVMGGTGIYQICIPNYLRDLSITIVLTVISVITIITAALMLHGIVKRKPGFLIPWLVFSILTLLVSTTLPISLLIYMASSLGFYITYYTIADYGLGVFMFSTIFYGLFLVFGFYIWDVVRSAYKQIKEEDKSNQLVLPYQLTKKIAFKQTERI